MLSTYEQKQLKPIVLNILDNFLKLRKKYPEVFSEEFDFQFIQLISLLKNDLTENITIRQFSNLIITKYIFFLTLEQRISISI